jgi:hypothetical protein
MIAPRFFSHPEEQSLLPENLGVERYALQATPLIKHRNFRCEISGFESFGGDETTSAAGYMMLELRDPRLKGKDARKSGNLRVVDPLFYWARHVDLAIKHKKGSLIFAPWFTQTEIIALFRSAAIVSQHSKPSASEASQFASSILEILTNLQNGELLISTLGIEGDVSEWRQEEWLESLQMMPAKQRKLYTETFAKNLRFLPSLAVFREAILHWSKRPNTAEQNMAWSDAMLDRFRKLTDLAA